MDKNHTVSFILFVFAFTGNSLAGNTNQLKVGITSSLNKVYQSKTFNFKGLFSHHADIELALNEYESTQTALFPDSELSEIKNSINSLIHDNKINTIDLHIPAQPEQSFCRKL